MNDIFKIHIDKNRVYGLDILRCLAILFVLIHHANFLFPKQVVNYLINFSVDGVSMFFILSGFLIGGILIKTIERDKVSFSALLDFWKRRWFRTLPNYFLILIVLVVLHSLFQPGFSVLAVKKYFFFSQNLLSPHHGWFFPEAWSLSIEEWFYLITPIFIFALIVLFKAKNKTSLLLIILGIIITITTIRYYRYLHVPVRNINSWDVLFRKQVFTRLDSLMYGVIGAYLAYYHNSIWLKHKNSFLVIGVLILAATFYYQVRPEFGLFFCVFSFSLNSLATLFLLPFLSTLKTGKGLVYQTVTYISLISYSMYLINFSLVKNWILGRFHLNHYLELPVKYVLFWALTIMLSVLLYKYFEMPITKLRDRKKARRRLAVPLSS